MTPEDNVQELLIKLLTSVSLVLPYADETSSHRYGSRYNKAEELSEVIWDHITKCFEYSDISTDGITRPIRNDMHKQYRKNRKLYG